MTFTPVPKNSGLRRKRVQIAVASIVLLAQYAVLLLLSEEAQRNSHLVTTTLIGCLIATALSVFLARGISRYPGVEASTYITPSVLIAYGFLLLAFILGRLEYSRILLTSSFAINLVLFTWLYLRNSKSGGLRIGIVPEGEYRRLFDVSDVQWSIIPSPEADLVDFDAVVVDLRANLSDGWERRLAECALRDMPVFHSKHLIESLTGQVELEHLSENSFGTLSPLHAYMSVKHAVDWLAAALGLVVLAPAFLVIGMIIKLDTRGPVFFRQSRIGYQGRPFTVFKFRTMTVADQSEGSGSALEAAKTKADDQRITRSGSYLRRTRLDELPQLLNVLKGEMSWIGPRPEAEVLSRWYEEAIPFYRYRHIVRPGITGWAQVNQGHVAEVAEVKSKLNFDFYYIRHFSPWIDVLIVVRTIRTMLTGFGAR